MSEEVVRANADREGVARTMGITRLTFKVLGADTGGGMFVIEQVNTATGGPPRHTHPDQDEWFYVVQGDYVVEVGDRSYALGPGDSVLAPRGVPHVWACVGTGRGRMIVTFTPAGHMEAFFRRVATTDAMPTQDPALWEDHGMRVVGPPLVS
ncbi:MAG: cupin domain-containing protein [Thermoleophilia bacterium]